MEINVEKSKIMRISRDPSPLHITIDKKELEYGKYSTICVRDNK
jgi:hypothetical protein